MNHAIHASHFAPGCCSDRASGLTAWTRAVGQAVVIGVSFALMSCASASRPVLSESQLQERAAADTVHMQETIRELTGRMVARMEREVESASESEPAILDFLALSGGGDFGAFGAGFLVGWGSVEEPGWSRPDFDAVTGVSTGAFLAPFAFVGTDESCRYVEDFYRNPKSDWIKSRGLLFFLPSNSSFMTIPGLERDIRTAIDAPFVEQIAEQSRKGKVLVISATDLDLGRQKFWNVGVEAEAAAASGDPDRIQRILLASAAIPAIFPPIAIDDSVYADGGVTANVFLRLDPHSPDAVLPRWWKAHPDTPFPKMRYWVIVNNQLRQPPKTVQVNWPSIIGPSLATAIRSATIAEVRWLAAQADYVNARWGTEIEVRVVAIPDDWRPPVPGDFKKETMESLSDLGRQMGADPQSWNLWTTPALPESSGASDSTKAGSGANERDVHAGAGAGERAP